MCIYKNHKRSGNIGWTSLGEDRRKLYFISLGVYTFLWPGILWPVVLLDMALPQVTLGLWVCNVLMTQVFPELLKPIFLHRFLTLYLARYTETQITFIDIPYTFVT